MMKRTNVLMTVTMMLLAASVTAQPQTDNQPDRKNPPSAQPGNPENRDNRDNQHRMSMRAELIPSERATGATVVGVDGAKLGKIDDLIIDAGPGEVLYAVLSHGGVLGIGDKLIAVPWRAFAWDTGKKQLTIPMTKDQLNAAPTFDPKEWNLLREPTWTEKLNNYFNVPADRRTGGDMWNPNSPYQRTINDGQAITVSGTVKEIVLDTPMGNGHGAILTIQDKDGTTRTVHLGPSSYVSSQRNFVKVGDQVDITGTRVNYENQGVIVARTIKSPGGEYRLRDEQGRPLWHNETGEHNRDNMENRASSTSGALIKLSTIKGETILNSQKEKVGKADEVVFDAYGGRVAFVVVSFGGFLGINDTLVPLPWDMFQVGSDGKLFAGNITKDQLKDAPRFEKNDWAELKDPAFGGRVYQHYGRRSNWLTEGGAVRDGAGPTRDGAGSMGEDNYTRLYNGGTAAEYTGTVKEVDYNQAVTGAAGTTLVVIDTNNGEMSAHLAPRTFLDQNSVSLNKGDKVTIRGRTAMVDGKKVLIATDIRTADGKTLTLRNKEGGGVWIRR